LGGLYSSNPGLGILFLIPALSLAGLPPLSGFFAKLTIVQAGLQSEQYLLVATALVVGLLTLFSMTKVWAEVFWKEAPGTLGAAQAAGAVARRGASGWLLIAPIISMAAITITIGLAAEPVYLLAIRAAEQLIDPTEYIERVLKRSF
jgi:multicomponent Na+:H+ antiporter subunit D